MYNIRTEWERESEAPIAHALQLFGLRNALNPSCSPCLSLSLFIYNPTRSLVVTANSVALILFVSLSLVRSLRCAAIVILCLIARGALSFSLLIFAQGQLEVFKFIYVCAHVYTYLLMCVHIHACVCASYLFVHGTIKLFVGLAFASLSFWFFFSFSFDVWQLLFSLYLHEKI